MSAEAVFTLVGVVLGFVLTTGYEALKGWRSRRQRLDALYAELEANLLVIESWRSILGARLKNLPLLELVRLTMVGFLRSFYDSHSSHIPTNLGNRRYVHVHTIYSNLRTIEDLVRVDATVFNLAQDVSTQVNLVNEQHSRLRHAAHLLDSVEAEIRSYLTLPKYEVSEARKMVPSPLGNPALPETIPSPEIAERPTESGE